MVFNLCIFCLCLLDYIFLSFFIRSVLEKHVVPTISLDFLYYNMKFMELVMNNPVWTWVFSGPDFSMSPSDDVPMG